MTESTEVIKAVNELINAQADQLWEISISVIIAEIFIIAHLISLRTLRIRHRAVIVVLCLSVLCHAMSLAFGYLSKGALIYVMISFAEGHGWEFPEMASTFNVVQVISVTIGLIIFVVCFFFYSRELAKAMIQTE